MTFTFAPAETFTERAGLFVSLTGGTNSGKTFSALRLARGIAGPTGKIAVLDTVDQHFRNSEQCCIGVRAGLGDQCGELPGLLQCPYRKLVGFELRMLARLFVQLPAQGVAK